MQTKQITTVFLNYLHTDDIKTDKSGNRGAYGQC